MNSRNIPAVDEARKLGDRFVRDFENMSYEQLREFYEKLDPTVDGWTTLHREKLPSGTLVGVHALICCWGLVRRRISVEVNVSSDHESVPHGVVPCDYFERFASGRISKASEQTPVLIIGLGLALLAVSILLLWYVS